MHDIKYIFLNKNNQTIQGAKKFQGRQITESIIEKYYFSKSKGTSWTTLDPPLNMI
jgi:hypothetical protein